MSKSEKRPTTRPDVVFNLKALSRHLKRDLTDYVPRKVERPERRGDRVLVTPRDHGHSGI